MRPYYDADGITIYHGDCRDVLHWLNADAVVTDPPYGIGWSRGMNNARASKAHTGILNDENTEARDEMLTLADGKPSIVFGSFYAAYPANVKQVLVWQKPSDAGVVGSVTGFRRDAEPIFLVGAWPLRLVTWSSVIRSSAGSIAHVATQTGHPHTKPIDLMLRLVELCPGEVVADPFMGSGTTLVAAKRCGRQAIGIEVEERYCEIAAERLSQGVLDLFAATSPATSATLAGL
jgi:site-specific DNA-methyltransferase (adenine-specific)